VTTEAFIPVAEVADFASGTAKTVVVDGTEVALFFVDGEFYALDNTCPHQGGPLAEGYIEGLTVTCPWHAWCFNLTDGKMPFASWAKAAPYDVRVEGGRVLVARTPRPEET
jgi:nitrite reductase/ring-hydroxylating ferredoxin subunit